jgi:hypothetical protein
MDVAHLKIAPLRIRGLIEPSRPPASEDFDLSSAVGDSKVIVGELMHHEISEKLTVRELEDSEDVRVEISNAPRYCPCSLRTASELLHVPTEKRKLHH